MPPISERLDHNNDAQSVELAGLTYDDFDKSATDVRNPDLRRERELLIDSKISKGNYSPTMISEWIHAGSIVSLHRSLKNEVPLIVLLVISVILVFVLSGIYLQAFYEGISFLLFVPLVIAALIAHLRFNAVYFIEKDGITEVKGVLLFHLSRLKCELSHVKTIEVSKNIFQRLLNTGNIRISTALVNQPEIVIEGVNNPYFYASVLRACIEMYSSSDKTAKGVF